MLHRTWFPGMSGHTLEHNEVAGRLWDIREFGAKCNETTDDSAAFQSCVNAVSVGGGRIVLPSSLRLGTTINLTNRKYLEIEGQSCGMKIISATGGKPAFDCLGAERLTFKNLRLFGDELAPPNVGWLFGRTMAGPNSSWNEFSNVIIGGHFSLGAFYMVSSEVNRWNRVSIEISGPPGVNFGLYISANNDLDLSSEYETLNNTRSASQQFLNYVAVSGRSEFDQFIPVVFGDMVDAIHIQDSYLASWADCAVRFSGDHALIDIDNLACEGNSQHSLRFTGAGKIISGLSYRNSLAKYRVAAVAAEAEIRYSSIERIRNSLLAPATKPRFEFTRLFRSRMHEWGHPYDTGIISGRCEESDISLYGTEFIQ